MKFRLLEAINGECDDLGNELSQEQINFFKNSKVRDENGRLLVCHHGTNDIFDDFNRGDIGFHFGTLTAAEERKAFHDGNNDNWNIKVCYLNIEHPFIEEFDYGDWSGCGIANTWLFGTGEEGQYAWRHYGDISDDIEDFYIPNDFQDSLEAIKEISLMYDEKKESNALMLDLFKKKGYDGIVYTNYYEDVSSISYIIFNSNQAKYITNKTPSSSGNMNEALEEIETGKYATDSPYDIKNLIQNKPDLYRIVYDSNIDRFFIGDAYDCLHDDLVDWAIDSYCYDDEDENNIALDVGRDYYKWAGVHGTPKNKPYLFYMAFVPKDFEFKDDEEDEYYFDDDYTNEYELPYGSILTRRFDINVTPLKILNAKEIK